MPYYPAIVCIVHAQTFRQREREREDLASIGYHT
jgi:hypothetical protein